MLKLRDVPHLQEKVPFARIEDRVYASWQAVVEGQDRAVTVLVDVEGLAGKGVSTDQISGALERHRQLIEKLANAVYESDDEAVFVHRDQLTWEVENAARIAP
jgi:hypothetical protein